MSVTKASLYRRARGLLQGALTSLAFLPGIATLPAHAVVSGAAMGDFAAVPVTTVESVTPLVMLTMSRDHQYFFRAYNDYTDLDPENDDGVETTYDNTFEYYGYFDPKKCYTYSDANGRFEPQAFMTTLYYCNDVAGDWSGNFLNWATMTRMDIVRKLLYGGKRATDTPTLTVLERAMLPHDAHSFAKYYNGDDLPRLTPFTVITDGNGGDGDGFDDEDEGITICNTTRNNANQNSQNVTDPPLMRVVRTNRQLWAANERWQCTWDDEEGDNRNSNRPAQSGIDARDSDPPASIELPTAGGNRDRIVRVEACNPALIENATNFENCRQYPDGNFKPTGLLQRYGESEQLLFGLITGSYEQNISGGMLRKNIGNIADEVNQTTDGTFRHLTAPLAAGIIQSLDTLRAYGYRYGNGTYNGGGGDNCRFQMDRLDEGTCTFWGNPISEIYYETLRYFARAGSAAFATPDDTGRFPNLRTAPWPSSGDHPLQEDNRCAQLNAIVFNASVSSYDAPNQGGDGDDYPATGALQGLTGGSISINSFTEQVGAGEGINGGQYFVGKVLGSTPAGADDFEYCTAKTVDSLANAVGLCPEGPTVDGSYNMAGLAYYARTNDLIPDTAGGLDGMQDVRTFAISLATTTPVIEVPNGPNGSPTAATILPAYRLIFNNGGGALVDFKIVQSHTEVSNTALDGTPIADAAPGTTGRFYGKYYINWEDSEQGGDYDQDMWGVLDYLLDTGAGTLTIRTNAIAESTINGQLFGFTINGTTQDGFHAYSGIEGANFTDPTGVPGCANCRAESEGGGGQRGPQQHTFTLTDATAGVLESPLFYAAKWGGFNDLNGNGIPDDPLEWDTKDTSGNEIVNEDGTTGDGIPDNYFFVTNPAALEDALTTVFDAILERVASGTAASVVANEQKGTGAVFQALYDPVVTDTADNEVTWVGTLQGIFVDAAGFLREDGDGDAILDDYNTDPVIDIFFDDTLDEPRARLRRFTSSDANEFVESGFTDLELTALDSLWNAREELSDLSDVTTHRGARTNLDAVNTASAGSGRQIWTWLDRDFDGLVDQGASSEPSEQVPFDSVEFDHTNAGWLDIEGNLALNPDADTDVDNLVNYIRGEQVAGRRNRVVDYDGDGTVETIRLGDIVHSTPTPAAVPAEAYDLLALDLSYFEFRNEYRNRRQVVYIGANDGMIHAFNGGFFEEINDAGEVKFGFTEDGPDGAASHPLGSELWAYVPRALLPHLKWLARNDYSHVYYMDLKPRLFDARIFPDDTDHPDGWGTVLVVGMRFGGGNDTNGIIVDAQSDGRGSSNTDGDDDDDVQTKSAYVIMDVTNPEKPPKLIAEVSPPGLNLTTSFPAVAAFGTPTEPGTAPSTNEWYLIFGNGPESVGDAVSSTNARLYAYDLEDLVNGGDGLVTAGFFDPTGDPVGAGFDLGEPESFVSDPVVRDDDLDMRAEVLYFGTVGDLDSNEGKILRVPLGEQPDADSWAEPHVLLDAGQPFVGQLSVTVDQFFEPWVIGGTGRLYVTQDKANSEQQSLYGFIDPNERTSLTDRNEAPIADFVDVTGYRVFDDGSVSTDGDTTGDTTFTDVANDVRAAGGWVRNFDNPGGVPSQRTINRSPLVNGVLFSTAFAPADDICGNDGEGELIALDFLTGTPRPARILGGVDVVVPCPGCPDSTVTESLPSVSLGVGVPSPASIHVDGRGAGRVGSGTSGDITVIVQKSTGAIQTDDATVGAGPNPGEMSWREYRDF